MNGEQLGADTSDAVPFELPDLQGNDEGIVTDTAAGPSLAVYRSARALSAFGELFGLAKFYA